MSEDNNDKKPTSDLGSWLNSMGAPVSITELMPSEITGLDIAPLLTMLGGVGIKSGVRGAHTGGSNVDEIRWLPIVRSQQPQE
jgi:hypothetical protein